MVGIMVGGLWLELGYVPDLMELETLTKNPIQGVVNLTLGLGLGLDQYQG